MNAVESPVDFARVIGADKPLLVCFQADWCGDCHYLKPSLPDLEHQFASQVDFVVLDIDRFPALAQEHEVTGIPSFILFQEGREIFRLVNERRKTKDEIKNFLEKGLSLIHR